MFGRMMNSYYYGKSGKGDYRKEDLPKNRWQLFWEMLRIRFSGLCRINLMTVAAWLPMIFVLAIFVNNMITVSAVTSVTDEATGLKYTALVYAAQTDEAGNVISPENTLALQSLLQSVALMLIPCILITGPVQAGLAYVTRNWARDEHAFPWADFRDAVKENWKQGLGISAITAILPLTLCVCFNFYGQLQTTKSMFFILPQMCTIVLGMLWCLALVFLYPLIVSYKMTFRQLLKNGMILAIARFPMAIGVRLVTLLPAIVALLVMLFTGGWMYALLALLAYYLLIGNALTRFIYASFANGVFDKFINANIEGVEINRGLAKEDADEYTDEDEPEDAAENTDK